MHVRWKVHQLLMLENLPKVHQPNCCRGKYAQVFLHEQSCDHNVVFELFVRFKSLLHIVALVYGRVWDTGYTQARSLLGVLEDLVQHSFFVRLVLVLPHFLHHCGHHLVDEGRLEHVQVLWQDVEDLADPLVAEGSDNAVWDHFFDVVYVALLRLTFPVRRHLLLPVSCEQHAYSTLFLHV